MKNKARIAVTAIVAMSMLAACGGSSAGSKAASSAASSAAESTASSAAESAASSAAESTASSAAESAASSAAESAASSVAESAASSAASSAAESETAESTVAEAASSAAEESAPAASGGTLRFGCYGYAQTLDPSDQINAAWDVMRIGISECLFKFDDSMTIQNNLCDSYEVSDDHVTWTFHILDGLKYSNGDDVTPQSIIDCWEVYYANTEGSSKYASYMDYESLTADDEARTLTVVLKAPQVDLRKNLAYPVFGVLNVGVENFNLDEAPIGTGPYAITAYEPKVSASLVRNEYYWNGEVPYDALEVLYIQEDSANTKAMALEAGDVDLVENITATEDLAKFKNDPDNYNFSQAQGVRCGFAYVNQDGILGDEVLRQAIQMALDDETMCSITVGGLYTPGMSVLPSTLAYGYDQLTDPYAYDPEAAAKLLDDAGYVDSDGDGIREKDGEKISLRYITYDNRKLSDFAQAIQSQLTELGFEVNVNVTDSDTEWNMMVNGEYDLCDSNWTTVGTGDPTEYLRNWYGPAREGDAKANYCNYQNDEFDKLYEELQETYEDDARADLIKQMQQILIDDAAVVVHGYYNSSMISNKTVDGANIHTADYYWITTDIKPAA